MKLRLPGQKRRLHSPTFEGLPLYTSDLTARSLDSQIMSSSPLQANRIHRKSSRAPVRLVAPCAAEKDFDDDVNRHHP